MRGPQSPPWLPLKLRSLQVQHKLSAGLIRRRLPASTCCGCAGEKTSVARTHARTHAKRTAAWVLGGMQCDAMRQPKSPSGIKTHRRAAERRDSPMELRARLAANPEPSTRRRRRRRGGPGRPQHSVVGPTCPLVCGPPVRHLSRARVNGAERISDASRKVGEQMGYARQDRDTLANLGRWL